MAHYMRQADFWLLLNRSCSQLHFFRLSFYPRIIADNFQAPKTATATAQLKFKESCQWLARASLSCWAHITHHTSNCSGHAVYKSSAFSYKNTRNKRNSRDHRITTQKLLVLFHLPTLLGLSMSPSLQGPSCMNMCLQTRSSGRDVTQEMVVVIRCLEGTLAHGPAQIDYGVAALRSIPKTDLLILLTEHFAGIHGCVPCMAMGSEMIAIDKVFMTVPLHLHRKSIFVVFLLKQQRCMLYFLSMCSGASHPHLKLRYAPLEHSGALGTLGIMKIVMV
jgi:hypothetical protein